MKIKLLVLVVMFCFSSCDNIIEKRFLGKYCLIGGDIEEDMALSYDEGNSVFNYIVEPTVFAAGFNKSFIIIKQHPNRDKNITNYFIVRAKARFDWLDQNNVIGPLTIAEFNKKKKQLGIEKLKFSIVYEDLQ